MTCERGTAEVSRASMWTAVHGWTACNGAAAAGCRWCTLLSIRAFGYMACKGAVSTLRVEMMVRAVASTPPAHPAAASSLPCPGPPPEAWRQPPLQSQSGWFSAALLASLPRY